MMIVVRKIIVCFSVIIWGFSSAIMILIGVLEKSLSSVAMGIASLGLIYLFRSFVADIYFGRR